MSEAVQLCSFLRKNHKITVTVQIGYKYLGFCAAKAPKASILEHSSRLATALCPPKYLSAQSLSKSSRLCIRQSTEHSDHASIKFSTDVLSKSLVLNIVLGIFLVIKSLVIMNSLYFKVFVKGNHTFLFNTKTNVSVNFTMSRVSISN